MKLKIWILMVLCLAGMGANAKCASHKRAHSVVKLGVEVLADQDFRPLQGKNIALCTNPTGVNRKMESTIDILFAGQKDASGNKRYSLVSLMGPEHGVRGNEHAGDLVASGIDEKTGLKMLSLYGNTRKPTKEMLQGVDAIVYDIQDNGCRSFTYISTMGMLMEACAENNIELIVLDRPNPLGGEKIEGNLVEEGYISFVSQFKIPYLYGMTCGELALYLNAKSNKPCCLKVIPMEGWRRDMTWLQTGLEWVVASPHIPEARSTWFYPVTGIFGELGYINIGVGYTLPFQLMGAPWVDADTLSEVLNALELPGIYFRPIYFKPYYSVFSGQQIEGVQIHIMDYKAARLSEIQFLVIQEMMRLYPDKDVFRLCDQSRFGMFDKVCGTKYIREEFGKRYRWEDVSEYWYKDVENYRKESSKYYLY